MNIQRIIRPSTPMQPIRYTIDAYFDMAPVINPRFERTELLDGVIYQMPIDGPSSRRWNSAIAEWLIRSKGDDIILVSHQTLPLGPYWAPSPDHYLFPKSVSHEKVAGPDVLLVIEVSDTSLGYDIGGKADAYAAHGVREYWVIDLNGRRVFLHRLNDEGRYGEPVELPASGVAQANLLPRLSLRLSDLPGLN
jgi:Uma2 family endonuclease